MKGFSSLGTRSLKIEALQKEQKKSRKGAKTQRTSKLFQSPCDNKLGLLKGSLCEIFASLRLCVHSFWLRQISIGISVALFFGCDSPSPSNLHSQPSPASSSIKAARSDSSAIRLAEKVLAAAGGREKFEAANYLSFHFVIESDTVMVADWRHDWDREKNRYRLEGELPNGEHVLVLMHLNQQTGRAFRNGQPVPAEEAKPLLALAYSRFLSDFYWLLLPFKLQDPGTRLEYQGEQKIAEASFEVIRLSFAEKVGLTPENSYKLFVDPATFHLRRWEFFATPQSAPLIAWWENWRDFAGISLATERRLEGTNRKILFEEIIVSSVVNESLFAVPTQFAAEMF